MVQEIITYTIVTIAVIFAFRKLMQSLKKFRKKKSIPIDTNTEDVTSNAQHKCSDCIAECIFHDSVSPLIKTEGALCKKIENASD